MSKNEMSFHFWDFWGVYLELWVEEPSVPFAGRGRAVQLLEEDAVTFVLKEKKNNFYIGITN